MPAVTTLHQSRSLQAAIKAMGGLPAVDESHGVSSLAIGAMNWAAWEDTIRRKRRLEVWRLNGGLSKVAGSRRMIYDTRQRAKLPLTDYYGGPFPQRHGRMYRWASKQVTATEIAALQHYQYQSMMPLIVKMNEQLNNMLSHQIDAMAYGLGVMIDPWAKPLIATQPKYHERASTWQAPAVLRNLIKQASIVSAALRRGTLSSEPPASPREPSWRVPGGRSRTRRKSTA